MVALPTPRLGIRQHFTEDRFRRRGQSCVKVARGEGLRDMHNEGPYGRSVPPLMRPRSRTILFVLLT